MQTPIFHLFLRNNLASDLVAGNFDVINSRPDAVWAVSSLFREEGARAIDCPPLPELMIAAELRMMGRHNKHPASIVAGTMTDRRACAIGAMVAVATVMMAKVAMPGEVTAAVGDFARDRAWPGTSPMMKSVLELEVCLPL
jgi:hypothetical protein